MAGKRTQFRKGQSGNPAGRPKGIVDRRVELRALLEPHAPALVAKVVSLALRGNLAALRICLDRVVPPLRPVDAPINVPALAGSLSDQGRAMLAAVAAGNLPPDLGAGLIQALGALAKITETDELDRRVTALEKRVSANT